MKKLLMFALCVMMVLASSCAKDKADEGKDAGSASTQKTLEALAPDKEKFTEYEKLTDKFMEYCESSDIEGIYSLYYEDRLTKTYERLSDKLSKQEFDAMLKAEMAAIYSFEEFEYGCEEMPPLSSPLSYVNQLLYNAGEASLEIEDSRVTNCVDLRVYKNDGAYPSDHMMACIDGYWYFIL